MEPIFKVFFIFSQHLIEVFFFLFEDHKDAVAHIHKSAESPKKSNHVGKDGKKKRVDPEAQVGDGEENAGKAEERKHEKKEKKENKATVKSENSHIPSEEAVEKNVDEDNKNEEEESDKNEVSKDENETEPVAQKQIPSAQKSDGKQGQGNGFKLAAHSSCRDDVKQLCSSVPKENNFAILICLQDSAAVSCICSLFWYCNFQHFVFWHFTIF